MRFLLFRDARRALWESTSACVRAFVERAGIEESKVRLFGDARHATRGVQEAGVNKKAGSF